MDKTSELTDAYAEVRFASFDTERTQIHRKSLNPVWNEDFRFEVSDDADLQNEPLDIRIFDYDAISANDMVGSVMIDLNPLLANDGNVDQIMGFFPIFDTMNGIRGELQVQIKVQQLGDLNPFKNSSTDIQFFSTWPMKRKVQCLSIIGLADVMIHEFDLEYHWSDTFRTTRSSNEARKRLYYRFAGQLKRQIGRKVSEMGGDCVICYKEYYDIEPVTGTVLARAVGAACKIEESLEKDLIIMTSADLLTLNALPGCKYSIGGIVTARSVKQLTGEENERESWWYELRDEVKSHAKLLNCSLVIGYTETASICGDMCVLTAMGTAISLQLHTQFSCEYFHSPYDAESNPFLNSTFRMCEQCGSKKVPSIILATTVKPDDAVAVGEAQLIIGRVSREKKSGDSSISHVSEMLPFLEYDMHRQLICKAKLRGHNAIFNIKWKLCVGESLIVAIATGTSYCMAAMPLSSPFRIANGMSVEDGQLYETQCKLLQLAEKNRASLMAERSILLAEKNQASLLTEHSILSSEESLQIESDESAEVVEIDDEVDEDLLLLLLHCDIPEDKKIITNQSCFSTCQYVSFVKRALMSKNSPSTLLSSLISSMFKELFEFTSAEAISDEIDIQASFFDDSGWTVQIVLSATVWFQESQGMQLYTAPLATSTSSILSSSMFPVASPSKARRFSAFTDALEDSTAVLNMQQISLSSPSISAPFNPPTPVVFISLSPTIPSSHHISQNMGRITMHVVKEDLNLSDHLDEEFEMALFIQNLMVELMALARANVIALGGNALVSFKFDQMLCTENVKNQAYALLSVSGDVLLLESNE